MTPWSTRPAEEAFLLNPAFCAAAICATVNGYVDRVPVGALGMPFLLPFLALPLALHARTRETLPRSTRTSFAGWLESHPETYLGYPERVTAVAPFVRDAIQFGGARHALALIDGPRIQSLMGAASLRKYAAEATEDGKDCLGRAAFVGKWLALAGSVETVFGLLGVQP